MHIVLTDVLTCPRCGPEFGLILLADRVESRRVVAGSLGCSNCREKYPVVDGVARFDGGAGDSPGGDDGVIGVAGAGAGDEGTGRVDSAGGAIAEDDAALRLGALLGVTHGPGFLLLAGESVEHAAVLARLIEDIEVVTVHVAGGAAGPTGARPGAAAGAAGGVAPVGAGVSALLLGASGRTLPLATGRVAGIALAGQAADDLLEESIRALSPVARLVLMSPPADVDARLATQRLRVLARDQDTLVAARY